MIVRLEIILAYQECADCVVPFQLGHDIRGLCDAREKRNSEAQSSTRLRRFLSRVVADSSVRVAISSTPAYQKQGNQCDDYQGDSTSQGASKNRSFASGCGSGLKDLPLYHHGSRRNYTGDRERCREPCGSIRRDDGRCCESRRQRSSEGSPHILRPFHSRRVRPCRLSHEYQKRWIGRGVGGNNEGARGRARSGFGRRRNGI